MVAKLVMKCWMLSVTCGHTLSCWYDTKDALKIRCYLRLQHFNDVLLGGQRTSNVHETQMKVLANGTL